MPNDATPETLTAGPTTSLAGASSRLRVACARASLKSVDDSVDSMLTAAVWSVSSSACRG